MDDKLLYRHDQRGDDLLLLFPVVAHCFSRVCCCLETLYGTAGLQKRTEVLKYVALQSTRSSEIQISDQ